LGVAVLLSAGLGDTVRISLTESSEREMEFGEKLLQFCRNHHFPPPENRGEALPIREGDCAEEGELLLSPPEGPWDCDGANLEILRKLLLAPHCRSVRIGPGPAAAERREIAEEALQACGRGQFRAEIVACPTCGRTAYDVAAVAEDIRRRLGHWRGLRIAVMGCAVNGPGEMGNADYGYVGTAKGRVNLYGRGVCLRRGIPAEIAVDELERLLQSQRPTETPNP
jgi:4-hydroxy-3-methylbut-2-en-1-yl diphosphate synthase IspG/GcpE